MKLSGSKIFKYSMLLFVCLMIASTLLAFFQRADQKSKQQPQYCRHWGNLCGIRDGFEDMLITKDLDQGRLVAARLVNPLNEMANGMSGTPMMCRSALDKFVASGSSLQKAESSSDARDYYANFMDAASLYNEAIDAMLACNDSFKFGANRRNLPLMKTKLGTSR